MFCKIVVPLEARTSMVDGFPYKEEVGGSSPSVPTKSRCQRSGIRGQIELEADI
jgi:hypothetical protein